MSWGSGLHIHEDTELKVRVLTSDGSPYIYIAGGSIHFYGPRAFDRFRQAVLECVEHVGEPDHTEDLADLACEDDMEQEVWFGDDTELKEPPGFDDIELVFKNESIWITQSEKADYVGSEGWVPPSEETDDV